jgi:FkbM family methyltransferase
MVATDLITSFFRACGLHVSKLPPYGSLGRHLARELFPALSINCVLDVGAHRGEYGRFLREIGYSGEIVSFEPTPASFDLLRRVAEGDQRWQVCPWALGNKTESREFHVFGELSKFNSLEEPSEFGAARYHLAVTERPIVAVKRLDEVFTEVTQSVPPPVRAYLKMDTQGHDRHVMTGATGCHAEILALQSELAARRLYRDSPRLGEALSYFEDFGYLPTGFFPVNLEPGTHVAVEWDCVMQRIGLNSGSFGI